MAKTTIQERFDLYHAANPHVYRMYLHFTKQLLRLGHKRISPRFVLERIRWEMMVSTVATPGVGWHVAAGKPFKINDHFSSRYARLLIAQYPKLSAVFEIRGLRAP
jgi:hypothetical protein